MKTVLMTVLVMCAVVWGQTVALVSPVRSEEWVVGSTHQIKWTGNGGNFNLIKYTVNWVSLTQNYPHGTIIDTSTSYPQSFTPGSFSVTWKVPDTLRDSLILGVQMWNFNSSWSSASDTLKIIGRPKFTSPKVDSVISGAAYSYKVKYTLPGNPVRYTRKLISKPTWITADTAKDSIYGTSPNREEMDTVKYAVKVYTQKVIQSIIQNPTQGHMDTTWTAIDSISDTLKLSVHVKYLVTGVIQEMPKYAISSLRASEYVYDLRGRKIIRTGTGTISGIYFGNIPGMKKIQIK